MSTLGILGVLTLLAIGITFFGMMYHNEVEKEFRNQK